MLRTDGVSHEGSEVRTLNAQLGTVIGPHGLGSPLQQPTTQLHIVPEFAVDGHQLGIVDERCCNNESVLRVAVVLR